MDRAGLGWRLPSLLISVAVFLWSAPLDAQVRARIPSNTSAPVTDPTYSAPGSLSPFPSTGTLGTPTFDPYSTSTGTSLGSSWWGGSATQPPPAAPSYSDPSPVYPPAASSPPSLGGSEAYPSNPPALFPNGFTGEGGLWSNNGTIVGAPIRLLTPRLRHTWLEGGDDGREVDIHDTDVSLVLTYPNFLFSNQPLYIAPAFSIHLWDNPKPPEFPATSDLPGQAYSAHLDALWRGDLNPSLNVPLGLDLGGSFGVYTDFDTFNSDSLRALGMALLRLRVTPTLTLKGGVAYVDRVRIKVIPIGGVLWEPNPQSRFDLYFPSPKVSQYLTTIGNQDLWWYIAGEYGGGSWTIERAVDGGSDQIDINDIRVIAGVEWGPPELFRQGQRIAFFEAGWVTNREILYARRPQDNTEIDDTFMLRLGVGY